MVIRGDYRDLPAAAADDAAIGERCGAFQAHDVVDADTVRDAPRRAVTRALRAACLSSDRADGTGMRAQPRRRAIARALAVLSQFVQTQPPVLRRRVEVRPA